MGTIVQFAIVLLVAGGFIAWLGDRLGTIVGKKRLSKFGLRPKHTAMLYTIASGSLIALLTLAVLLICQADFRIALIKGRQLSADNRRLSGDNSRLAHQNTILKQDQLVAFAQTKTAQDAAKRAEDATAKSEAKLTKAQAAYQTSRAAVAADETKLQLARQHLDSVQSSLGATTGQLREARDRVANTQLELSRQKQDLQTAQRRVDDAQSKLIGLAQQSKTLVAKNTELTKVGAQLLEQRQMLESKLIYLTGDEVGRTVISTGQSVESIRSALVEWIDGMGHNADKRGAGRGANGREVVVQGDGTEPPHFVGPEMGSLDLVASNIRKQAGIVDSVVVVGVARYNTPLGAQVKLDVKSYDNVLVFNKGETVASTTVDGTLPYVRIQKTLESFLTDRVRSIAQDKSIMPSVDPETGKTTYGGVVNFEEIVPRIQQAGASARVAVIATNDIYTEGPLAVRLEVAASGTAPQPQTNAGPTRSLQTSLPVATP